MLRSSLIIRCSNLRLKSTPTRVSSLSPNVKSHQITTRCLRSSCLTSAWKHPDSILNHSNSRIGKLNRTTELESNVRRSFASDADLPSHTKVPLPALSPTMEMGTIISWEKKEGDKLNEGDLLAEIETDKATMGFETPEEGYLARIIVPAGTKDVAIGKLLCIIVENEEDIAAFKDYVPSESSAPAAAKPKAEPAAAPPKPAAPAPAAPSAPKSAAPYVPSPFPTTTGVGGRLFASPLAKRLATEQGIDLMSVAGSGSGPGGRIVAQDLSRGVSLSGGASSAGVSGAVSGGAGYTDIQLTGMRRAIAKRLTESKQTIPHYYLCVDIEINELLRMRQDVNESLAKENIKVSLNDFLIKAASLACIRVPEVNSSWMETFIRQNNSVDVSVAVSTPAGLLTPIIFDADLKGIKTISQEMKHLAQKAKDGKLQPQEFQGGTFTISNLGMFGISHFSAVINPPQACILAVGGSTKRLVPSDDGITPRVSNTITATLSCDHRVVDGAVGAQWLQHLKTLLEKPFTMVI